jgi:hypothetical protein
VRVEDVNESARAPSFVREVDDGDVMTWPFLYGCTREGTHALPRATLPLARAKVPLGLPRTTVAPPPSAG